MAGVTDRAYRSMCVDHGADITFSEMISTVAVSYKNKRTWNLTDPHVSEKNYAVQVFGHDPDAMLRGASQIVERLQNRISFVDINMACPVRKIARHGDGAALMRDPKLAAKIVGTLAQELAVPITCKIRIGLDANTLVGAEFAQTLEQAGAKGLGVHGRTVAQQYHGSSNLKEIARIVQTVSIPVLASGDVLTPQKAKVILGETGAYGLLVARGSYGNPWIFSQIKSYLETGKLPPAPTFHTQLEVAREHVRRHALDGGHMPRLRKVVAWYVKGMPEASMWRAQAMQASSENDFLHVLDRIESFLETYGHRYEYAQSI